jgi:SAM-dependent methyltransferase
MLPPSIAAAHDRARLRFAEHRKAFLQNEPLRRLYGDWYSRIGQALPAASLGPVIELGSGPGLAAEFIPNMLLTDVVFAPWHHLSIAAESLPFKDGSVGAVVLFDVLHHLPSPQSFLNEAVRALSPGGRVLICDPYISPLSYPVYRWLHEEGFDFSVDPFEPKWPEGKDPFSGNQAVATELFFRKRVEFQQRFPALQLISRQRFAGPSYPLAGGFARKPILPQPIWDIFRHVEGWLPPSVFAWAGFRTLVVLERI